MISQESVPKKKEIQSLNFSHTKKPELLVVSFSLNFYYMIKYVMV